MRKLFTIIGFLLTGVVLAQIDTDPLKIGETAPVIIGTDQNGKTIDSRKILKENRILLVFYRGNWCPYCKKHLGELEQNLVALQEKGIVVLVVTPESVAKTRETEDKFETSFSILHDSGNRIMKDFKVGFEVNQQNVPKYYDKVSELVSQYNSEEDKYLPVPATYLIGMDGEIEFVHYDPDYTKRSDISEIVSSL